MYDSDIEKICNGRRQLNGTTKIDYQYFFYLFSFFKLAYIHAVKSKKIISLLCFFSEITLYMFVTNCLNISIGLKDFPVLRNVPLSINICTDVKK